MRSGRQEVGVPTTRRGFLGLAGSSAALAALGTLRVSPSLAAPGAGIFFGPEETEILTHVVERMVAGAPEAAGLRETGAIAAIDHLCAGLDPALTEPLPLLMRLVDWGPYIFDFTFERFTAMSPEAQDTSLRCWMESRLEIRRLAFSALRNLAFLGWYSQPESWRAIGYAGPLLRSSESPA
jgi:hypothetical protein